MTSGLLDHSRTNTSRQGLLRIAVVGCGAVAQQFHLPVLAGHEGVQLSALIDRDVSRAGRVASQYGIKTVAADAESLNADNSDGVIIATPPSFHASAAIDFLSRGINVFVEKPMALNLADAQAMVQAADESEAVLAVGVFRRLLPCARLLRAALEQELLGKPLRFDVADGAIYGWSAVTLGNMRRELSGGGVLIDMGSHTLDRLLYLFPGTAELLEYSDNALGGIESDCLVRLRLEHKGNPIDGRVELSRTRNLHNKLRVECERGTLELRPGDRFQVWVVPHEDQLVDTAHSQSRTYALRASWAHEAEGSWYEPFRVEIDDWLDAIRHNREPQLSGKSVLPTVQLIEQCYKAPKPMNEPWVQEGLNARPITELNGKAVARPTTSVGSINCVVKDAGAMPRRVLVTGATGFIGCRVAEILQLREGMEVRALVHKPSSAARLARLPVEMIQGDLQNPKDVAQAVAGCDAVVHCAVGTEYGQPRRIRAVTVGGTRNLAAAARVAGVQRFVHLSSIAVLSHDGRGQLDEDTPVRPRPGEGYGRTKAESEQALLKEVRRGLPAIILRPGCVYGPHGQTFVTWPMQALTKGRLILQGCSSLPSNTVYVDNVAEAIVCALRVPASVANGQAFVLSDGDELTWGEFYGFFADNLGGRVIDEPPVKETSTSLRSPWRWLRMWVTGTRDILLSAESKALAKKVLQTDPYGYLPRTVLEMAPALERWLRRKLGIEAVAVYRRPPTEAGPTVQFGPHPGVIRTTRAQQILGYGPAITRARALELTLAWVRHAHLTEA
jgi:predicted dehydrogenase/nucleoside-diphosphate-sugar epimerase